MDKKLNENHDLYLKVLKLNPELWQVAQLTTKAREKAKYPLKDYDDLLCLADDPKNQLSHIEPANISLDQAKRYFPLIYFPITDEDDFIMKVLIAILWGKKAHALEAELSYKSPPLQESDDDEEEGDI